MDIVAEHNEQVKVFHDIVGCAFDVYNEYRPGLTEYPYQYGLRFLLRWLGYDVRKEYYLPLYLFGHQLEENFRCDLVMIRPEGNIIIECKAANYIVDEHRDQLKNYMLLTHSSYGMLINFAKPNEKGSNVYSEAYQYHPQGHYVDRLNTKFMGGFNYHPDKPWKDLIRHRRDSPQCTLPAYNNL